MEVWLLVAHIVIRGERVGYQLMGDREVWKRKAACETALHSMQAVYPQNDYSCIRFVVVGK